MDTSFLVGQKRKSVNISAQQLRDTPVFKDELNDWVFSFKGFKRIGCG